MWKCVTCVVVQSKGPSVTMVTEKPMVVKHSCCTLVGSPKEKFISISSPPTSRTHFPQDSGTSSSVFLCLAVDF